MQNQPKVNNFNGALSVEYEGTRHVVPGVEVFKHLGFRVYVTHYRFAEDTYYSRSEDKKRRPVPQRQFRDGPFKYSSISPLGGETRVLLLAPNGEWGEATVKCSRQDGYNRRLGYVFAVEKALRSLSNAIQIVANVACINILEAGIADIENSEPGSDPSVEAS